MSKKKVPIFEFELPLYGAFLMLFIGSSSDFVAWVKKEYDTEVELATDGRGGEFWEAEMGVHPSFIRLEEFNWTTFDQCVLTHELLHFIFYVLGNRGLSLTPESEEAYTYALQDIQQQVWLKLKDYYDRPKSVLKRRSRKTTSSGDKLPDEGVAKRK